MIETDSKYSPELDKTHLTCKPATNQNISLICHMTFTYTVSCLFYIWLFALKT